jgi:integrase
MQIQQISIAGLIEEYEAALKKSGLGYYTRLRMLGRASIVVNRHHNAEYLDSEIIAKYFRELEKRYANGEVGRVHYETTRREVQRLLWFAETGSVRQPNPRAGCRQTITPEYSKIVEGFLSVEMHHNTRGDARWIAHKYFAWLTEHEVDDLHAAGAMEIQKFLLDCSGKMSVNSMHDVRLYLAKLYAYLYETGLSDSSYQEFLSFKVNRENKVYPLLPRSDIAKLLDTIDRTTARGKRAYAVMMLGTVLGLRACDIITLKLNNIDWVRGEIKFIQSKTGKTAILPLTTDVGEALKDYILNARPDTDAKQIFMRLQAPFEPIKAAVTIGEIYEDCCKNAGLPVSKRFHNLRRSLATSMTANGVSIYDVAQGLGDADIESTKPYIAMDTDHLKMCALPFDGIMPVAKKRTKSITNNRDGGVQ